MKKVFCVGVMVALLGLSGASSVNAIGAQRAGSVLRNIICLITPTSCLKKRTYTRFGGDTNNSVVSKSKSKSKSKIKGETISFSRFE